MYVQAYTVYIDVDAGDAVAVLPYPLSLWFHVFIHACAKTRPGKLRVWACNRWECNSFCNIATHLHNICFFISLF
jgi:hypothetical protein